MPKLNLISTLDSPVIVGDPGSLVVTLSAKEMRSVEVTKEQLDLLTPQLEKLQGANWIKYSVGEKVAKAEPVKVVEKIQVKAIPAPSAPPPPKPSPEPQSEEPRPELKEEKAPEAPEAPAVPPPSAPKPQTYDKKNRR